MPIQLRTPTPKRLFMEGGVWALEVERYLPIEARVFRPSVEKVVGEARITRVLREGSDDDVERATLALMRSGEPGPWEIVSGEWMRCL